MKLPRKMCNPSRPLGVLRFAAVKSSPSTSSGSKLPGEMRLSIRSAQDAAFRSWKIFAYGLILPGEVRKCPICFGHAVRIQLLFDGDAFVFGCGNYFFGQFL